MKPGWLAAVLSVLATAALAQQRPPIQEAPLPPLRAQGLQRGLPPVQQMPGPSGFPAPGARPGFSTPGQLQAPVAPPPTVTERPNLWVPASEARLQALDKVNAQTVVLTIKVGQSATFGSLTIAVRACVVRPNDQPADAAAFLGIIDSHPDSPGFDGWMLQVEPSVSMLQHPIYDLRVTGCA